MRILSLAMHTTHAYLVHEINSSQKWIKTTIQNPIYQIPHVAKIQQLRLRLLFEKVTTDDVHTSRMCFFLYVNIQLPRRQFQFWLLKCLIRLVFETFISFLTESLEFGHYLTWLINPLYLILHGSQTRDLERNPLHF